MLDRVQPVDVTPEDVEFSARHQGGSGAVWVSTAYTDEGEFHQLAVFGSAKTAREWADALPPVATTVIHTPYVVDEPDYGIGSEH